MALNTTSNSGTQASTQSPQTSSSATTNVSGNLQPGIANSLLNRGAGVPLHGTALSTVSLGSASTQATTATTAPAPSHHFSAGLLVIPLLLLVIAAFSIRSTNRSVKNTTK